ncbi:hypothetical protein [Ideonella sp. YS5]|uniref:hypothetical protein n=1 Tax=Ideonella sp. YS5 TaxID=3453714 RepID=UPI003EEC1F0A
MNSPQRAKSTNSARLRITLGRGWQPFVPSAEPDTELLGTVSRGAQVGALARLADGSYVQINGDWRTPLNSAKVEHALRAARVLPGGSRPRPRSSANELDASPPVTETPAMAAAPVVVRVRKRRVPVLPPQDPAGRKG